MLTVAELPEYIHTANKLLTEFERQDIIRYLAEHPKSGDLMEGTGGVRKLRWGRGGQGKSGGVRVIYPRLSISPKAAIVSPFGAAPCATGFLMDTIRNPQ